MLLVQDPQWPSIIIDDGTIGNGVDDGECGPTSGKDAHLVVGGPLLSTAPINEIMRD